MDLIERLKEYATDWRVRAGSEVIVHEAVAKIESDAKVIATLAERYDTACHVIVELREALERIIEINPATGYLEAPQTKIARDVLAAIEQTAGSEDEKK